MHRRRSFAWAISVWLLLTGLLAATARAASADRDDLDACTLVPADVAQKLMTTVEVTVDAKPTHPVAGQFTCEWTARQKGYTADAPPIGRLTLSLYHFADDTRAIAQMRTLAKDPSPPSLVRTTDAQQDETVRFSAEGVAARHGVDIVVLEIPNEDLGVFLNGNETRLQADWSYRLESAALRAAGAHVVGPVDARATADACHLLPGVDLRSLVALSTATVDTSMMNETCRYDVQYAVPSSTFGHESGDIDVERSDLGTHAAALAELQSRMQFVAPSTLVRTADSGDRVVADPTDPGKVDAVHGPYVAEVQVNDASNGAKQHPTWAYRVQRTALQAAGATILAPANVQPDPVVPFPAPPSVWQRWMEQIGFEKWAVPAFVIGVNILPWLLIYLGRRRRRHILANGLRGMARINAVSDTGTTINNSPRVRFDCTVTPENGMPYQATTKTLVSRLSMPGFTVGQEVPVRIDPSDPKRFYFAGPI